MPKQNHLKTQVPLSLPVPIGYNSHMEHYLLARRSYLVTYAIEPHDVIRHCVSLKVWLTLHPASYYYLSKTQPIQTVFYLTPVSQVVPWLLAGLREAVEVNATQELLSIIKCCRDGGFGNNELDVLERSLREHHISSLLMLLSPG